MSFSGSFMIQPDKFIQIDGNITLDGNGSTILFSHPEHPQFIVSAGKTVTLKNLVFSRLFQESFDLRSNGGTQTPGKIYIGENVIWELSDNITFSQGALISLNSTGTNVFYAEGLGSNKKFNIENNSSMNLGTNTFAFKNIELSGIENITYASNGSFIGALGPSGESIVDVLGDTPSLICDKAFVASGINNSIFLKSNGIYFTGTTLFADNMESDLHLKFTFTGNNNVQIPTVHFGTGFVRLTSVGGLAELIFDDSLLNLINDANAFFVFGNSYFSTKNLLLSGDPIWNLYDPLTNEAPFVLVADSIDSTDLSKVIVSASAPSREILTDRPRTALHALFENKNIITNNVNSDIDTDLNKNFNSTINNEFTRAFPTTNITFYKYVNKLLEGDVSGSVCVDNSDLYNFYINTAANLNLQLTNNSSITQGSTDITLKSTDALYISGQERIIVKNKFIINGTIEIDEGSELIFEFDNDSGNAEVDFSATYTTMLNISQNSKIKFVGNGIVKFDNNFVINLNSNSSFILQDSVFCKALNTTGRFNFQGSGNILVDTGAIFYLGAGQSVVVGHRPTDVISLKIDRNAALRLNGASANFYFQKVSYSIDVEKGGMISLKNGALLGINYLDNQISSGTLTSFVFDFDGILNIENASRLILGPNLTDSTISWNNLNGLIQGEGLVGFAAEANFLGQIQTSSLSGPVSITSVNLVRNLINLKPNLLVSTLFLDINGNQWIKMKNGNIYKLFANDVIVSDGASEGFVYGTNKNRPFILYLDGHRS